MCDKIRTKKYTVYVTTIARHSQSMKDLPSVVGQRGNKC